MAPRLAILIALALVWLGTCVKTGSHVAARESCRSCHAAHDLEAGPCVSCHRGDPTAGRKELAHDRLISGAAADHGRADARAVVEGRRWVGTLACRRCHTVAGAGNRLAINLDHVVWNRGQDALTRSIREPVENMPRFGVSAAQCERILAFLLFSGDPHGSDPAYRIRFAHPAPVERSPFEEQCGGCHRALLGAGPAGRGTAGPNLSALFTAYYPATAPEDRRWTPAALRLWLTNPRAIRRQTTMRPVRLQESELRRLIEEFGTTDATAPASAASVATRLSKP